MRAEVHSKKIKEYGGGRREGSRREYGARRREERRGRIEKRREGRRRRRMEKYDVEAPTCNTRGRRCAARGEVSMVTVHSTRSHQVASILHCYDLTPTHPGSR